MTIQTNYCAAILGVLDDAGSGESISHTIRARLTDERAKKANQLAVCNTRDSNPGAFLQSCKGHRPLLRIRP
jgi:hypothetical protein